MKPETWGRTTRIGSVVEEEVKEITVSISQRRDGLLVPRRGPNSGQRRSMIHVGQREMVGLFVLRIYKEAILP